MFDKLTEMVAQFNTLAGLPKKFELNSDEFWARVDQQMKVVMEEVLEMQAAIAARDIVEVLDGAVDVFVTNSGMMDILERSGVAVRGAGYEVCMNNLSKITENPKIADLSVEMYAQDDVEVYIQKVCYGVYPREYFAIRRVSDNKIMKPYGYRRVELERFVKGVSE